MSSLIKEKNSSESYVYIFPAVYFIVVSFITNLLNFSPIAFVLISLPVFFVNRSITTLLCFYFFNSIALYDPILITSRIKFFLIPEIFIGIILFLIVFRRKDIFKVKIPITLLFFSLYVYVIYCCIMTIPTLQRYGFDPYVLLDLNDNLMLLLAPVIFIYKKITFKNYVLILMVIILSSAIFGMIINFSYFTSPNRKLTWNEPFFADALILSIILLLFLKNNVAKKILIVCIVVCFFAMIFTQTRSIWLSFTVCLILFFIAKLVINFKKFSRIFLKISIALLVLVGLQGFFNNQLTGLITNRLSDFKIEELINPTSSTGYRIYESYMVIQKASMFGYGSGARIHLVDTIGNTKWHHWWSIHNEYIEILHKYGFIGLGLFLLLLSIFFFKSIVLVFHRNSTLQTIGLITFLVMLQHCIISITSGYLIRDNIVPFLALLFALVETGWQRRKFYNRVAHSPGLIIPIELKQ